MPRKAAQKSGVPQSEPIANGQPNERSKVFFAYNAATDALDQAQWILTTLRAERQHPVVDATLSGRTLWIEKDGAPRRDMTNAERDAILGDCEAGCKRHLGHFLVNLGYALRELQEHAYFIHRAAELYTPDHGGVFRELRFVCGSAIELASNVSNEVFSAFAGSASRWLHDDSGRDVLQAKIDEELRPGWLRLAMHHVDSFDTLDLPAIRVRLTREEAIAEKKAAEIDAKALNGGNGLGASLPELKPTRNEQRVIWLAKAMLTVRDHPEWSDATIADRVRIHKSRLSRSPEYQAAARMARTPKTPDGSVTIADRDRIVEAVDDSFDPNRAASRQWQDEEDTDDRIDREMNERNAKRNKRR